MLVRWWRGTFTLRERVALALGCGLMLIALGRVGGSISAALGSWAGVLGLYLAGSALAWRILRVSLEQKEKGDAVASAIALLVFLLSAEAISICGCLGALSALGEGGSQVLFAKLQAYVDMARFWPVEPRVRFLAALAFAIAVFVGGPEAKRAS